MSAEPHYHLVDADGHVLLCLATQPELERVLFPRAFCADRGAVPACGWCRSLAERGLYPTIETGP